MPRYMLDTDTCSYIMKRSNDAVLKRLQKVPVSDVCSSVVTKAELLFGVEASPRQKQDESALEAFLRFVEVLDFPDCACSHYAMFALCKDTRGTKENRYDDRCERPVYRRPGPQPGFHARHQQYP